ncbi:hypothetical protein SAMN05192588_2283 [Nonlabens sp. Hel1_33_55]|nr:hypothetical protein SAMN05192588_2283 [Nonlabens sp. Hel1_33_55]
MPKNILNDWVNDGDTKVLPSAALKFGYQIQLQITPWFTNRVF